MGVDEPQFTEADLQRINERDELATRKLSGEPMTPTELTRLQELEGWLNSFDQPSKPLPPEVEALVADVLKRS